jgi:hypothetical protein
MIAALQEQALETGAVDADFRGRLTRANKIIFPRLLESIDDLLGLTGIRRDPSVAADCIKHLGSHQRGPCAGVAETATC